MDEDYNGVIGIVYRRSNPITYALIHNQMTGNITVPAGGKDEGEISSEETLKREIKEEIGLLSKDYKIIPSRFIHEFTYNSKKKDRAGQKARQPVYLVEVRNDKITPEDPDAEFAGWFTANEVLQKLTFSDSREVFKKVTSFLK